MAANPRQGHQEICQSVGHGCCGTCEHIGRRNALARAIRHLRWGARQWDKEGCAQVARVLRSEAAWLRAGAKQWALK